MPNMEPNMAKKEPDGCVTLDQANRQYRKDNKETEAKLDSTQNAVHRAIDVTFGRLKNQGGAVRQQKPVRSAQIEPNPDSPTGELTR